MAGTETATYVSDLDAARPGGSESAQYGDDHLRLIKSTLKATLPDGSRPVRDIRAVPVSTDTAITESSHDDAFIAVDTSSAAVTLTVDNTGSGVWVFMYDRVSGSNGITVKRLSDGATVTTYERAIIIVNGTNVQVLTTPPDGSITPAKVDTSGAFSMASLTLSGALTADSATITNSVSAASGSFSTSLARGGNTVWDDGNFAARIAALTENTSPAGTEMVACDDGQKVSLQNIADLASGQGVWLFESGWLSLSTSVTAAHGLTSPEEAVAILRCDVADGGYSVGDIITIVGNATYSYNSVGVDSTNVFFYSDGNPIYLSSKGGGSAFAATTSSWSIKLKCR